jgi:hypothetical protein
MKDEKVMSVVVIVIGSMLHKCKSRRWDGGGKGSSLKVQLLSR